MGAYYLVMDQFQVDGCALFTYLVRALVDNPAAAHVTSVAGGGLVIFQITSTKTDLGKVIGKRGRTIESLRRILLAYAAKCKRRAILEIIEQGYK
jgi:hypothetical protein